MYIWEMMHNNMLHTQDSANTIEAQDVRWLTREIASLAVRAMTDIAQLVEIHRDSRIVAYCSVAAYAWFIVDYIMVFPSEVRYVWNTRWNLSKFLYFWIRFWGILLLTFNVAVIFTVGCIMNRSVELLFQLRIYAMYNKNKWLGVFNGTTFVLAVIAVFVIYDWGISIGTTLATPPHLTGCYGVTTSFLFSIWIIGLTTQGWLAILALFKACQLSASDIAVDGRKLDLLSLLVRDNVIYFILIAVGQLVNLIIWVTAPDGLASTAVGMAHASMIVSGTRLMLNLYEAHHSRTTSRDFDDMSTVRFSSTKPHIRAWLDTSVLTEAVPPESNDATKSITNPVEEHAEEEEIPERSARRRMAGP